MPERRAIEATRTYLRLDRQDQLRPGATARAQADLIELTACTVAEWRTLYREIGAAWHWHDRDASPDEEIRARLDRPEVRVFRVETSRDGESIPIAGFLELEKHPDGSVEIGYFGLHQRVFGLGLGAWLLSSAVHTAFAWGATRVWLHTCTLDSPVALPNYLARGFVVERTENYVAYVTS